MLCACDSTKLYTEKEVINYLKARYNVEFIVLEKDEITRDKIEYKVALKDNQTIVFTIINELAIAGSDIGPKKNFINCKEITDYFENINGNNETTMDYQFKEYDKYKVKQDLEYISSMYEMYKNIWKKINKIFIVSLQHH